MEKDEGGRLEQCSAGVGWVVGWQMPEGFIRLQGGDCEQQFSGKSIRPKHKHRHASNPGLALHSLSPAPSLSLVLNHTHTSPKQSAPAHLYSCFLFVPFFLTPPPSFFFLSVFLVFLLLPCLSVKRSSH